jgi:hypothetical protein
VLGNRSKRWLFLCKVFPMRFLATDCNTGSINVTLQISLHYSTHEVLNHILSLQRPTSNSSTTNFPWLSPTENSLVFKIIPPHRPQSKHSIFKDACLQLRCLATDVHVGGVSNLRQQNMVMSPAGIGPEKGCAGEGHQKL